MNEEFLTKLYSKLREKNNLICMSDIELNSLLFLNKSKPKLTSIGFSILKEIFEFNQFKYDMRTLTGRHIITLSRKMQYPYYMTDTTMSMFSNEEAFMLRLHGGDMKSWLENNESKYNPSEN